MVFKHLGQVRRAVLRQAMAQSQRSGLPMAVVFLDLDGFKAINDQHGHAVGDQLLVTLAQRLKKVLREGDTLAATSLWPCWPR